MQVRSYAKINWTLRVTGRRADGYHDLETIFQTISLHDTLAFRPAARLEVTCSDPSIPVDETNLVVRAARALGVDRVAISVEKRIPAGGGLGGGSSNAAATLIALSKMFGLSTPLHDLALSLGSDVPFFLVGGTAYATGRGEVLTPLPDAPAIPLVLLLPDERVATPEAFRSLGGVSPAIGAERSAEIARAPLKHASDLVNDFEEPVFARLPRLRELKRELLARGAAWAGMSGSGSTIVGAFRDAGARDRALASFSGVRAEPAGCVSRAA